LGLVDTVEVLPNSQDSMPLAWVVALDAGKAAGEVVADEAKEAHRLPLPLVVVHSGAVAALVLVVGSYPCVVALGG